MSGRPNTPKVLLMQLSERVSGKGTRHLSGFLGEARPVAFPGEEPDRFGDPSWNVYAAEPELREDVAGKGRG